MSPFREAHRLSRTIGFLLIVSDTLGSKLTTDIVCEERTRVPKTVLGNPTL